MGPESRGSKKSFCPSRAAAGESRYLLVVSTGRAGNGESVLIIAHSCGEKPSPPDWPHATNVRDTNNRLDHSADFRITTSRTILTYGGTTAGVMVRLAAHSGK